MSVDAERVTQTLEFFHEVWAAVLSIGIACALLWFQAKWAMVRSIPLSYNLDETELTQNSSVRSLLHHRLVLERHQFVPRLNSFFSPSCLCWLINFLTFSLQVLSAVPLGDLRLVGWER